MHMYVNVYISHTHTCTHTQTYSWVCVCFISKNLAEWPLPKILPDSHKFTYQVNYKVEYKSIHCNTLEITQGKCSAQSVLEIYSCKPGAFQKIPRAQEKEKYRAYYRGESCFHHKCITTLFFCMVCQVKAFEMLSLHRIPGAGPRVTESRPKFLWLSKVHLQGSSVPLSNGGLPRTLLQNKAIRPCLIDKRINRRCHFGYSVGWVKLDTFL